jgi:hypothetical protein
MPINPVKIAKGPAKNSAAHINHGNVAKSLGSREATTDHTVNKNETRRTAVTQLTALPHKIVRVL